VPLCSQNDTQIVQLKYHATKAADIIWVPEVHLNIAENKAGKRQSG